MGHVTLVCGKHFKLSYELTNERRLHHYFTKVVLTLSSALIGQH